MNTDALIHVAIAAFIAMMLGFAYQVKKKNAGIVDAIWAFGIMLASLYFGFTSNGTVDIRVLIALLSGCLLYTSPSPRDRG